MTLRARLTAVFAALLVGSAVSASLTVRVVVRRWFSSYLEALQKNRITSIIDSLSAGAASHTAGIRTIAPGVSPWTDDYLHATAMAALSDGFVIAIKDSRGEALWDTAVHDMVLCRSILEGIAARTKTAGLPSAGIDTKAYPLNADCTLLITAYAPYSLSLSDFDFYRKLNAVIFAAAGAAILLSTLAAAALARSVTRPMKTLAHEIRTPITAISAQLEAIIDGVWEPSIQRLTTVYHEVRRLGALAADLTRIGESSNHLRLRLSRVNVYDITKSAVEQFAAAAQVKGIRLNFGVGRADSEKEEFIIQGDKNRLPGVFVNLVSNAVKYTPWGGAVTVCVDDDPDAVRVVVADTGEGIGEEVFKTGGTGLGLGIARSIVTAHGGTITVESGKGEGSRVVVTFIRT